MHVSHQPRRASRHVLSPQRQAGYVLVMFALLLLPLTAFVGLAVDVGNWYNHTTNMQKAADAAALAGAVWLPNSATATSIAATTATKNGYTNGVNHITVTIYPVGVRTLRVDISDSAVTGVFWAAFGRPLTMTRHAIAEYVLPVPLGSPNNSFGNDPTSGGAQPNLWGNIHGPFTDNYKGDAYAASCRGSDNCGATQNTLYRPSGYLYAIDVPAGVSNMAIQVYDAGLAPRAAENIETGDINYTGVGTTTTVWTAYNQDATPLDATDNPTMASTAGCSSGPGTWTIPEGQDATYKNKWATICTVGGTVPAGRYYLRVQTTGNGSGANRYAVKVTAGTGAVRLSAYGDMSMYNNVNVGNATFYLAEVAPANAGKIFEIDLYDPGEVTGGDGTIKVLDPTGAVASSCSGSTDSASSTFGSSATLTPCQFQSAVAGSAKYNGSWVTLQIQIPANYTCTLGTIPGCWWSIKYVITGQANDTTTWSAAVKGDPVHLING